MEGGREGRVGVRVGVRGGGGGSSSFVVVGARLVVVILIIRHRRLSSSFTNVVRPRYSLLMVGGVRRLPVVVAVFD